MSKDNVSLSDTLEEYSPDGHRVDGTDTSTTERTETIATADATQPKTLEELELEQLQAISQGELSDSAINYSSYTNKPNRIIQNPTQSTPEDYYSKGVVKISSRPDFKDRGSAAATVKASEEPVEDASDAPKRIDSRNQKARQESANAKRKSYARSHNEISDEDFSSMSEKLRKAKAKRQLQIDELNSKYRLQEEATQPTPAEEPPLEDSDAATPTVEEQSPSVAEEPSKPKKRSLLQKIVDYYTVPVDEDGDEEPHSEAVEPTSDTVQGAPVEPPAEEQTPTEPSPKKKETFKEYVLDLFTSKEKKPPAKRETLKERMVEFFTVEDDSEGYTPEVSVDAPTTEDEQSLGGTADAPQSEPTYSVEREVNDLLNGLVDSLPPDGAPIEEPAAEPEPIQEPVVEPKPIEVPAVEPEPIQVPTVEPEPIEVPVVEPKPIQVPVVEPKPIQVPAVEPEPIQVPAVESEPAEEATEAKPQKKPNVFRRIKAYFLTDEALESEPTDGLAGDTEDEPTAATGVVEPTAEPRTEAPVEAESVEPPVEEPVEATPTAIPVEEPSVEAPTEAPPTVAAAEESPAVKPSEPSESDYVVPFDEDASEDSIDIPIDEPPTYEHFWQDPDFNPIDRARTYWHDATERYRNRKRSGEIHIEIKSNPDTAILVSDLKAKVLAEERLMESREEYQKQVANGEYDDYSEDAKRVVDDEPVFTDAPSKDFNSYEDRSKVAGYVSSMKNSLLVRITVTAILCAVSLYTTLANDLLLPVPELFDTSISASGYLMVQSALGFVAILTSVRSVASGVVKVFKRKADSDSFASVGIVLATLASAMAFLVCTDLVEEGSLNVYMPIALLGMLSDLVGKYLIVRREGNNFRYISRKSSKYGLFCIQDDYDAEKVTKGLVDDYPVTAYRRKADFANDFIKYTYSSDLADRFSRFAVPIVCVVSLVVSLVSAIAYKQSFDMNLLVGFVSILSMLVSFCSCYSVPVCINAMLYEASKRHPKHGGAILGYQAVEDFYDTNSIIVDARDLFPKGSINVSALKLFSNAKIDETLIYAISMANVMDSILAPTLLQMLDGRMDMLCDVENCYYEDGLGLCGWIDNKRILMGNRELMEAHNIENLPTRSKELELVGSDRDCVYISVSGNLALMLILEVVPDPHVRHNLQSLQDGDVAIAVTSCDFMVSVNRLSYLFGVDGDGVKVLPYELYRETKEYFEDRPTCSSSIVTDGDVGVVTRLLMATKRVHRKATLSNMLNAVSCILGIVIGVSFITMGGFRELTASMVLLYNLVCTAIVMLLCSDRRS